MQQIDGQPVYSAPNWSGLGLASPQVIDYSGRLRSEEAEIILTANVSADVLAP